MPVVARRIAEKYVPDSSGYQEHEQKKKRNIYRKAMLKVIALILF